MLYGSRGNQAVQHAVFDRSFLLTKMHANVSRPLGGGAPDHENPCAAKKPAEATLLLV